MTLRFRNGIKDVNCIFRPKSLHFFALIGGGRKNEKTPYMSKYPPMSINFGNFDPPQKIDV